MNSGPSGVVPSSLVDGAAITWPEKEFKKLTAAFVRCNKEAWQMSPNTSTALFTFPKDRGGLQIKMPKAILCSAIWGHLTGAANLMMEQGNWLKSPTKTPWKNTAALT